MELKTTFMEDMDWGESAVVALDLETVDTKLTTMGSGHWYGNPDDFVCGVGIHDGQVGRYYSLQHPGPCVPNPDDWWEDFADKASNFGGVLALANAHYDLGWLAHHGVTFPFAEIHDVLAVAKTVGLETPVYSLEVVSRLYGHDGKATDFMEEKYGRHWIKRMDQVEAEDAAAYCLHDCYLTRSVALQQRSQELPKAAKLDAALIQPLVRLRQAGVRVVPTEDMVYQVRVWEDASDTLLRAAGWPPELNPNSAQHVDGHFATQGVVLPRTEKGNPQTSVAVMEAIDHPLARAFVERSKLKTAGGLVKSYINARNERTSSIHTELKYDGAVSGRFSSRNPNLQNIPKRNKETGTPCRSLFLPDEGEVLFELDYSSIEPRVLVERAFHWGVREAGNVIDEYKANPSFKFHNMVNEDAGIGDYHTAKVAGLATSYGASGARIAEVVGCSVERGEEVVALIKSKVPVIGLFQRMVLAHVELKEQVETALGNVRSYRGGYDNPYTTAVNHIVQGTSAEVMKLAMLWCLNARDRHWKKYDGRVLMTVHDSLVLSVPRTGRGRDFVKECVRLMELAPAAVGVDIPIPVEVQCGPSWGELKDVPREWVT